jgi:NAD+ synthase (glutamine-hydrolysing)
MWNAEGPARIQSLLGDAQLIVSINASPFHYGKWRLRERVYATRAFDGSYFLAYVNAVGGQDELIFDGHSMLFSPSGELLQRGLSLEEELILGDIDISEVFKTRLLDPRRRKAKLVLKDSGMVCHQIRLSPIPRRDRPSIAGRQVNPPADIEEIYRSLVLGIGDYVRKNGFSDVVIGLSGGLDSAITAALAVKALGKEHVVGVYMPAVFSSTESREDAEALAGSLEMRFFEIPIQDTFESYKAMLAGMFKGRAEDVTEENIQARIRGTILMALSNKFNWLVLTTGNKSETACGYCTLYGDTAGGFAPLKDVSKTQAYQLCEYVNSAGEIIPRRIIEKPPSAELRFNQKDTDSLPPYDHLDALLYLYIEKELSIRDIIAHGFDEELVKSVIRMVDRNEYKRRQAPPGIKITEKAFGRDRRLPVTNLFKPWASH